MLLLPLCLIRVSIPCFDPSRPSIDTASRPLFLRQTDEPMVQSHALPAASQDSTRAKRGPAEDILSSGGLPGWSRIRHVAHHAAVSALVEVSLLPKC